MVDKSQLLIMIGGNAYAHGSLPLSNSTLDDMHLSSRPLLSIFFKKGGLSHHSKILVSHAIVMLQVFLVILDTWHSNYIMAYFLVLFPLFFSLVLFVIFHFIWNSLHVHYIHSISWMLAFLLPCLNLSFYGVPYKGFIVWFILEPPYHSLFMS